jgi:hypothetical protein
MSKRTYFKDRITLNDYVRPTAFVSNEVETGDRFLELLKTYDAMKKTIAKIEKELGPVYEEYSNKFHSPVERSPRSPGRGSARSPGRSSARSPGHSSARSPGRAAAARSPGRSTAVRSPGRAAAAARSPGRSSARSPGRSSARSPGRTARSPGRTARGYDASHLSPTVFLEHRLKMLEDGVERRKKPE